VVTRKGTVDIMTLAIRFLYKDCGGAERQLTTELGRVNTSVQDLPCTAELHLSGLIGTAGLPDMQKIRIIGFFF
jgi:hypothetical protein